MAEPDWSQFRNFARFEFVCPCSCERADMDEAFMHRLQALRDAFGGPLRISSGFRCPDYNARISSTGRDGPHTKGRAADIAILGDEAYDLLPLIFAQEFTGIGIDQKGAFDSRFLHIDDLMPPDHEPRPWIWSY